MSSSSEDEESEEEHQQVNKRQILLNGHATFNRDGFTQTYINPCHHINMREIVTESKTITIHLDYVVPGSFTGSFTGGCTEIDDDKDAMFTQSYTSERGFSIRKIFGLINDIVYDFNDYCNEYYGIKEEDANDVDDQISHLSIIGFNIVGDADVYPMIDS